ncbi:NAD(P)/FAD-dependent oxidoreductase [Variovorax sp. LjRoot290]|uniref:FAD-dependent oxidoreductase n=1 Tax=unclassified Variovorax TaxID=663243 RepID=UPI003ED153C3
MSNRKALIAGAGIGALATGLALLKRGWKVQLFEQSDEIRILGAGIYIWENGLRVLESLGVYAKVIEGAIPVQRRERRGDRGELMGFESISQSGRCYIPLRHSLLTALRDGFIEAGGEISFGIPVIGADPEGELKFANGTSLRGDLIIGADGINSRVRDSLGLLRWRRSVGQFGYRIMIDRERWEADDPVRSVVSEHWNRGRRLLYAPCTREKAYVQLTTLRSDPLSDAPYDCGAWLATFPHLAWLIERIPSNGKSDWFEVIRLKAWSSGRVALIGDAASAQPPFLGQGGGVAMTSGLALAHALTRHDDVAAGIAEWERGERPFVEWVQSVSSWYGELARLPPKLRRMAIGVIVGNEWVRQRTIRCAAIRPPVGAS